MSCQREEIEAAINLYESDVTDKLHTASQTLCNGKTIFGLHCRCFFTCIVDLYWIYFSSIVKKAVSL